VTVDGTRAVVRSVQVPGFAGTVAEAAGAEATWDLRDPLDVALDTPARPGEPRSVDVRIAVRIPYLQVAPGVALVQHAAARTEGTVR
jgi:hypothetical protein